MTIAEFDAMLSDALQTTPGRRQRIAWNFLEEVKWRGGAPLSDSSAVLFLVEYEQPLYVMSLITKMKALPLKRIPDTNIQYLKLDVPPDANFEYSFNTSDAHFFVDPMNKQPLSWRKLSNFSMPGWKPAELIEPIPQAPRGKLDTLLVESKSLGYERWVYIYLPPGYNPEREIPYPFLLSGDGRSTLVGGKLDIILDNLLFLGKIEPLIGVMVTTDMARRNMEYQTQPEWREFIVSELLPVLRERYPLSEDPKETLVMGISFGGRMAIDMAWRYPDIFGMLGVFSPALHNGGEMLSANYSRCYKLPNKVFSCMGNERYNTPLYYQWLEVLEKRGVEVHTFEGNGGHSWSYWSIELPKMLEICFPKRF